MKKDWHKTQKKNSLQIAKRLDRAYIILKAIYDDDNLETSDLPQVGDTLREIRQLANKYGKYGNE